MEFCRLLCFIVTVHFASAASCPADTLCNNDELDSSNFVVEFCTQNNGTMLGHCCLSSEKSFTVIGLDLTNCNLTDFNVTDVEPEKIEIIDLRNNTLSYFQDKELTDYTSLNAIYLPMELSCPGGHDAWNISDKISSDFANFTLCEVQLDPCDYLNVSCTVNGHCLHKGPGLAKCLCNDKQYGYRCLQSGKFPGVTVAVTLSISTIGLSAFLWMYLRKNVIPAETTS